MLGQLARKSQPAAYTQPRRTINKNEQRFLKQLKMRNSVQDNNKLIDNSINSSYYDQEQTKKGRHKNILQTYMKKYDKQLSINDYKELQLKSYAVSPVYDAKHEQIQQILNRQNINLKEHCNFLISQVRKCNDTIRKYKAKLSNYKLRIQELQNQKDVYKIQCAQIKSEIFQGINRMQQIVHQKTIEQNSTQLPTKKNIQQNQLQNPNHIKQMSISNANQQRVVSPPLKINENSHCESTQPTGLDYYYLDQLNDKFETLMNQYRGSKSHESRRQCIQLAKQIKNIKMKLNHSQGIIIQQSLGNSSVVGRLSDLTDQIKYIYKSPKNKNSLNNTTKIDTQVSRLMKQTADFKHIQKQQRNSNKINHNLEKQSFDQYIKDQSIQ